MNTTEAQEWYNSRPIAVQKRIDAYPPTENYYLKTADQIVQICAYEERQGECNTCKVMVSHALNPRIAIDRIVFGVCFDDLERIVEAGRDAVVFNCAKCNVSLTITRHSPETITSGMFCKECNEQYYINWSDRVLKRLQTSANNQN